MKRLATIAILCALVAAGCKAQPAPQPPAPPPAPAVDLSRVDRIEVAHPASHSSRVYTDETAPKLAKALMASSEAPAATPTDCQEELRITFYAGPDQVATADAGVGGRPVHVNGKTLTPTADAAQLLQGFQKMLADPYMAQFIPTCAAWDVVRTQKANGPWRLLFLTEPQPVWVAIAIGPMGDRTKLFLHPKTGAIDRTLHLEAEVRKDLPPKDGKPPLTAPEALAKICNNVSCTDYEPVDVEFQGQVPLPMAGPGDTFPAWAITFADKVSHRLAFTGFFEAYTGGLVTEQMPPK